MNSKEITGNLAVMEELNFLKGIDIYLLDQLFKGRITQKNKVLDAGCGTGRNLIPLHNLGFDIEGFDQESQIINQLKTVYPKLKSKLSISTIEGFTSTKLYDFIICNAVLHFSNSHAHFEKMFTVLVNLLEKQGILFIRMTSNFATKLDFKGDENGITLLPDGSRRYLLSNNSLIKLLTNLNLTLIEPIKTVNVDNKRCMTTLVIEK